MVRRAFRGAFSADEIEDIYSGAWLGVLRALASRERDLNDDEIRSYVLTAVANQATRELRRRKRKPTAPLELVGGIPDQAAAPEDQVVSAERSQLTRDLLASLPPRRRAVMLLRYGWGLDPKQICRLVANLSPRAYRKEISRGVDELTEKMRAVEAGEWCGDREPVLKAYVAGLASDDEERQAKAHLAHCRSCSGFVARLSGHLHELGGAITASAVLGALRGGSGAGDRAVAALERVRDGAAGLLSRRDPTELGDVAGAVATSGAARGGGTAGAGLLAQLAGAGAAGKAAIVCLGGGMAATACVAVGVAPFTLDRAPESPRSTASASKREAAKNPQAAGTLTVETLPSQIGHEVTPPEPAQQAQVEAAPAESKPRPEEEATPLAESTPPVQQEFGVAAAAASSAPAAPTPGASPSSGTNSAGGNASAAEQEFGP